MIYDDLARKWLPAEGIQGVARVQIYQHQQNNTYRVVGRIMQDNTVSILDYGKSYQVSQEQSHWGLCPNFFGSTLKDLILKSLIRSLIFVFLYFFLCYVNVHDPFVMM